LRRIAVDIIFIIEHEMCRLAHGAGLVRSPPAVVTIASMSRSRIASRFIADDVSDSRAISRC